MESQVLDFAVIGAGMAGASVAWRLAGGGASVLVLEREPQPGYHATGRSAAMFMESYGTAQIRALTRASRAFYSAPPEGFCDHALLQPRSVLYIGTAGQEPLLDDALAMYRRDGLRAERIDARQACTLVPCLDESQLVGAVHDLDAMDIDVAELHQGFLRGMARAGARLRCGAELSGAEREVDGDGQGLWTLVLQDGSQVRARAVVNAAGAWADAVARLCGAQPLGIEPRRRSAFTFAAPEGEDIHGWPAVIGVDESFYFKPDAGQLLGSPANADATHPHDVQPEMLDIAEGIDRIMQASHFEIRRPGHSWAGLRSFVADGEMVIGWDGQAPQFLWVAAQGGYGIQSAYGYGLLARNLALHEPLDPALAGQGVQPEALSPTRNLR